MEAVILDTNFDTEAVIDVYESFIWTDRYCDYGDFEIYAPLTSEIVAHCKMDYYVYLKESEHMMIIEDLEIITDVETGIHVKITGRSLESILLRRIVWQQTLINGNLQNGIKKLIRQNIGDLALASRTVSNFRFVDSTDPEITNLSVKAQFTGDVLLDAIKALCAPFGIGFKITLNDNNQFVFKLYKGKDRSYNQTANPFVIFSPDFENFINSNYLESRTNLKTVALIAGEGEGLQRKTASTVNPEDPIKTGLYRRELYVDARDISSTYRDEETGEDVVLTDEEYRLLLVERGDEKLAEYLTEKSYEGEVDFQSMFVYGEDFFLGDTVQLKNEFGIENVGRIDEIVFSRDKDGYKVVPTFGSVE